MSSNQDPRTPGRFSRPIDAPSLPPWPKSRIEEDEIPAPSSDPLPSPGSPEVTEWFQSPKPAAAATEDPRELARRLAEEAKKRLGQAPPTADRREDPRELAKRLAEEAKQRLTPEARKRGTPHRHPTLTTSPEPLSERAATRPISAAEALAKAREEEKRRAAPTPASAPAPPAARTDEFARLLPGAVAAPAVPVGNADVFRALWRAHRARALHEKDLAIVATASVLLDAIERVAPGRLVAARVTIDGDAWAAWIDLDRQVLLGLAQPAEVYLAGL